MLLGAEIEIQTFYSQVFAEDARRAEKLEFQTRDACRELALHPWHAPKYEDTGHRRKLISDFSRGLYYTVEGRRIFIHAFLDLRQDPETTRRRLKQ